MGNRFPFQAREKYVMTDKQALERWDAYAATVPGFIGVVLRTQCGGSAT